MFDYVWQVEIIADDAPIEDGGSASGQRFSELDSTVFATVRPTLGANQGGHLLSGGCPDFSICTSWEIYLDWGIDREYIYNIQYIYDYIILYP